MTGFVLTCLQLPQFPPKNLRNLKIEFFTKDHWKQLPASWQKVLNNLEGPDLAKQVLSVHLTHTQHQLCHAVFPLSLLAFIKCTKVFQISRTKKDILQSSAVAKDENALDHAFRKHVSPKKQHEIKILSKVIGEVYAKEQFTQVIDVGSGQGHLSRLLSFHYDLPVISLEHEQSFVKKARIYDEEVKLRWKKLSSKENNESAKLNYSSPNHVHYSVSSNVDHQEFLHVLKSHADISGDSSQHTLEDYRCLLTGLHACGDLSATMIRLFKESDQIRAIVSVACCYMKITTAETKMLPESKICYPLSSYVKGIENHELSYKSRELACHAIEDFYERLLENGPHLKMHCYRAVLEHLITKYSSLVRPGVQTIKKAYLLPFEEYVERAFIKLGLTPPNEMAIKDDRIMEMLGDSNKVVVVFTLALMMAPAIETIILLDRMMYLAENGLESDVVPLFDPLLSPRCFAIIAHKSSLTTSAL